MNQEQLDMLNQAPPAKELRTRRADDGTLLTYLEGRYIVETLNAIFGPDGWSREFAGRGLQIVDKSVVGIFVDGGDCDIEKSMVRVSVTCEYRILLKRSYVGSCGVTYEGPTVIEDVGFGQSKPFVNVGDAIESACKEAVTDALKRCARTIGNALGLCLYNRKQESKTPYNRWEELEMRLDEPDQAPPTDADFPQVSPAHENPVDDPPRRKRRKT